METKQTTPEATTIEDVVKHDIAMISTMRSEAFEITHKIFLIEESEEYIDIQEQIHKLQERAQAMKKELVLQLGTCTNKELELKEKIHKDFPQEFKTIACDAGKATLVTKTSLTVNNPISVLRELSKQNDNVLDAAIKKVSWNNSELMDFVQKLGFVSAEYVDVTKKTHTQITTPKLEKKTGN